MPGSPRLSNLCVSDLAWRVPGIHKFGTREGDNDTDEAEDAATMDVLCVDKTGTITMNQLVVTGVIPLAQASEFDVLFAGAHASQEVNQDPIDHAFLSAANDRHVFDNLPKVTPVSFAPFDAKNRRTEAVVEQNGLRFRVMKGAVRTVAEACGLLRR